MKRLEVLLAIVFLAGCTAPPVPLSTPSLSSLPNPTQTISIPSSTPKPVQPTDAPTVTSTVYLTPTLPVASDDIQIKGSQAFIQQTRLALDLLKTKAPDAYTVVVTYVSIIEQGQHSGMWAFEDKPRYEVGDATAFYSVTWYASTIAHDATHSELYHKYLQSHPGESVPDDIWIGVGPEQFCIAFQLDVLKRIGGPPGEVDYLATQTGTHCDLDSDGDCDYDDYLLRNW